MPIAEPPLVSNDSRLRAPSVSGSCALRSAAGIGVPPAPVSAPRTSPSTAVADAGSPDFCAASMRARAASMRLARASVSTVSPLGVVMVIAPPEWPPP